MEYTKAVSGQWVKSDDVKSGTKAKLLSETQPKTSKFTDDEGKPKMQDVSKIRFEGVEEPLNIALNRATIYGLIDAFGSDSKEWVGKTLIAQVEKMIVGGRNVKALYLIPDGFELGEDAGGYTVITEIGGADDTVDAVDDYIDPASIPF